MEPRRSIRSAAPRLASRLLVACLVVAPAAVSALGPNTPDKLQRFQRAAKREHCDAVPYVGHRKTCLRNRDAQERACEPSRSCERDEAEKVVRDLDETRANLVRQPGNEELKAKRERLLAELKELKDAAREQEAHARACWRARKAVHDFFGRMRGFVAGERPPRGSQLERDVRTILRHYDREQPGHAIELRNVRQRERSCKYVAGLRAR